LGEKVTGEEVTGDRFEEIELLICPHLPPLSDHLLHITSSLATSSPVTSLDLPVY
jgi:hypothetical protein